MEELDECARVLGLNMPAATITAFVISRSSAPADHLRLARQENRSNEIGNAGLWACDKKRKLGIALLRRHLTPCRIKIS